MFEYLKFFVIKTLFEVEGAYQKTHSSQISTSIYIKLNLRTRLPIMRAQDVFHTVLLVFFNLFKSLLIDMNGVDKEYQQLQS